jgi:predicted anti-sigma-YlaC factor YlaD
MKSEIENGHIELVRLDALRAGEGTESEKAHLGSCRHCRTLLSELESAVDLLRNESPPVTAVPRRVDETILREYRRHFPARRRWRLPAYGAAAAAVLALAVSGQLLLQPAREEVRTTDRAAGTQAPQSALAREDVNGDGQVNIMDAFRLARTLKGGGAGRVKEDFNGDGRVNEIDVDLLARKVVAL